MYCIIYMLLKKFLVRLNAISCKPLRTEWGWGGAFSTTRKREKNTPKNCTSHKMNSEKNKQKQNKITAISKTTAVLVTDIRASSFSLLLSATLR